MQIKRDSSQILNGIYVFIIATYGVYMGRNIKIFLYRWLFSKTGQIWSACFKAAHFYIF